MSISIVDRIKNQIATHDLLLYMKGTPQFPQCGFSSQVAQILKLSQVNFAFVNILENSDIRKELPEISSWPTFPQVYLKGVLIGGCDIVTELYESGELHAMFEAAGVIEAQSSFVSAV